MAPNVQFWKRREECRALCDRVARERVLARTPAKAHGNQSATGKKTPSERAEATIPVEKVLV